ncbi:MAG: HlyD family efflux transporter periplasmic adaptor subunit [Desulfococcaceae bacterium]|nr:HlyD family efflux transporter periplasmic adaptor subunit [Desulfococcaceae bacterium]
MSSIKPPVFIDGDSGEEEQHTDNKQEQNAPFIHPDPKSPAEANADSPEKRKIEIRLRPREETGKGKSPPETEMRNHPGRGSQKNAHPPGQSRTAAPGFQNTADPRQIVLARFIRFCGAVFSAALPQEAAALVVNRVSEVVRTDRAVLVRLKGSNPIIAVTGGGAAAQDSSFADAVEAVRDRYKDRPETVIVPRIPDEARQSIPHLWTVQQAMGGTRILWLPLRLGNNENMLPQYALWLERWQNQPWEKGDVELLQHASLFLGRGLAGIKSETRGRSRVSRLVLLAVLLVFLALPVTSSVTAPVRVVPDQPHHIFAPMDGILKDLLVRPGQWVEKDEMLFRYDARVLDKRLDEAYRNVAVAKAKYIRLEGAAHRDPDARAEMPVQEMEVQRAETDAEFFAKQRARADVRTARPGVIVLDDPDSLIGAALQTGQAVMSVADPSQTKLRIMVPASDVGFLKKGAQVAVRLDSNPLKSLPAVITRVGFEVKLSEEQIPSVLTEAIWVGDAPEVRPGQKGTVKIYGESTFLGWQILRKPLIILRSITGF